MPETSTALPLVWGLAAYFVLQILLNMRLRLIPRAAPRRGELLLRAAFGNGVINSLYFMLLSGLLLLGGFIPAPSLPSPLWLWLLGSFPAGVMLWAVQVRLRGIGVRLFGTSTFVQPAEHLLRSPLNLGQLNQAALYISLLQPLGHELFFRACFLGLLLQIFGIWPAVLATAIVELLLRLNPTWALSVIVSSVLLSGLALAGGGPLTSICTALVAGFLHAYITAWQALRSSGPPAGQP